MFFDDLYANYNIQFDTEDVIDNKHNYNLNAIVFRSRVVLRMLVGYKRASSLKILIINRKGGAGKSTFSIALASLYDHQNIKTELIDLDPQGTCYFWGNKHRNG
jgi:Mrp family chromosome partitioning ATPase